MNDVQHFEAARALAERMLAEGGATDESRIAWLYRTVLSPTAGRGGAGVGDKALEKQRDLYRGRLRERRSKAIQRRRVDAEEHRAARRDGGLDDGRESDPESG